MGVEVQVLSRAPEENEGVSASAYAFFFYPRGSPFDSSPDILYTRL